MNNIKKDTSYITLLSVISCIAVIILHTNHVFWDFDLNNFKSANIIESVFYFAVPIFFMISGANLINYNERYSTKEYFIKRLKRTVIPFCIWNMIIFLQKNLHSGNIADINIKSIFQYMIKPPNTYYFFIPLFCIYAVIPLFSAVTKEKRKFVFSYIVIVAFSVNILIPFLKDTVYYFNTGDYWHIGVCSGYAIYPVLGYLLKEYEWNRKIKTIIYLLALTGVLMQIIGTYRLSLREGQISIIFKGYANLSCVWYSCGVFLLFKDIGNKLMKVSAINKLINFLGKYTFCIYLLHESIYYLLCIYLGENANLLICRLGLFMIIVPVCVLIIFLLRKIPFMKYILP